MTEIILSIGCLLVLAIAAGFGVLVVTDNRKYAFITGAVASVLVVLFSIWYFTQTASGSRDLKTAVSDVSGGLDRTVKVYDYDGELLESYSGRIDIRQTDVAGRVLFDLNGKRITIDGGIVITEEETEQ